MTIKIRKASGALEEFNPEKVKTAILRAGGTPEIADQVIKKLDKKLYNGIPTRDIYRITFGLLDREQHSLASRYDLKRAIMRLGPAGFSFETYLGEILKEHDYSVKLRQNIQGRCVEHEVDIILDKDNEHSLVECKYHNQEGIYTGLKSALYTYARFVDLNEGFQEGKCENFSNVWLVTNTKFSNEAIQYASCRGIRLFGWRYPPDGGIERLIESKGLYPITILRKLDNRSKEMLSNANLMLVNDLIEKSHAEISLKTRIPEHKLRKIIEEVNGIMRRE